MGLTPYLKRKPGTLSGGQRQRVALGRAIVRNPKVFLFDEPLSNLDAKLRVQMRIEISSLQKRLGVTTIYVTHDQIEAMTMADRIAVLKDGVLQQFDTPMRMYDEPVNLFVAGFIGSPAMNFLLGTLDADNRFVTGEAKLTLDLHDYLPNNIHTSSVMIGIRPEDIHGDNALSILSYFPISVKADVVEPMGSDSFLYFRTGEHNMSARLRPESTPSVDQQVTLYIDRSKLHYFNPDTGVRL